MWLGLLLSGLLEPVPEELDRFLARPNPAFAWKEVSRAGDLARWELTSQEWQGRPWKHTLLLIEPERVAKEGVALLYVTGDRADELEVPIMRLLAARMGLPAAILYDIPNQPLWGMREDDLIAHTFEKYLETGDPSWPLLFPMTHSVLRAMDALEQATARSQNPIRRFVVAGASKRGWTSWLVGASRDPRVAGIAPMVIDNLDVETQMRHQMETWGRFSPQIDEYTRRGLQARLETEDGRRLSRMIDPFTYRSRLTIPKLIVNGGNDEYWVVDALAQYWDELPGPKWAVVVPNAGHDLGVRSLPTFSWTLNALVAFTRHCAGLLSLPNVQARIEVRGARARIAVESDPPYRAARLWVVTSDDLSFAPHRWEPRPFAESVAAPEGRNAAVLVELQYELDGYRFSLTSPAAILRGTAEDRSRR